MRDISKIRASSSAESTYSAPKKKRKSAKTFSPKNPTTALDFCGTTRYNGREEWRDDVGGKNGPLIFTHVRIAKRNNPALRAGENATSEDAICVPPHEV